MKHEVRLEILKLVHRHDHTPEAILSRAKEFENWVLESKGEPASNEIEKSQKGKVKNLKSGNVDPLS